jgi:uncharacterized lipoprotein YddW (UPF0748 family)
MRRRNFVETVGAAALGTAFAPAWRVTSRRAALAGWTWVHGNGDPEATWRDRFQRLADHGITGVLVGGGDLDVLTSAAHAAGLTFHSWTWMLNRSGDARVKAEHPEWFDVSRNGESSLTHPPYVGYYQWLCPTRPAVRAYLNDDVDRIAAHPGVDGVHLDYIRHPDVILPKGLWAKYHLVQDHEMPEYDFCYCEVCRSTFTTQYGTDPLQLPAPTANEAWRHFRYDSVTDLVRGVSRVVHARGKAISAAVFPTPAIARTLVRQAWDQWPLDIVFPMLYHTFYEEDIPWIGRGVRQGVAAIAPSEPLCAGLYLPSLDPDQLGRAVRTARDGGAVGVSCFDANGLTDPHLSALATALRG